MLPLAWSSPPSTPSLEPISSSCLLSDPFHRWNMNHANTANARTEETAAAVVLVTAPLISTSFCFLFLSDGCLPSSNNSSLVK